MFRSKYQNFIFCSVYIMAVNSLISVESLSSACVNCLEFADMRFILSVPL